MAVRAARLRDVERVVGGGDGAVVHLRGDGVGEALEAREGEHQHEREEQVERHVVERDRVRQPVAERGERGEGAGTCQIDAREDAAADVEGDDGRRKERLG